MGARCRIRVGFGLGAWVRPYGYWVNGFITRGSVVPCCILNPIILNLIILNPIILSLIILNPIILSLIILNLIILSLIILNPMRSLTALS